MAATRAHEASSSTCYDVFLSFRGEDTRKTFTDHLYTALVQQGFRTFRDDDEIEKGEYLKSELQKAICQSKISIVVISKDYASSTWCLDELEMILEQRRRSGHVVLPVFYHVDPSQIRKQTGRTADAFAMYEKQFKEETNSEVKTKLTEKIKRWRSALTEVANLIGLDLQNQVDGHEAKFIQKIVEEIRDKLRHTTLVVAPYEIGIAYRAKDINMWLQDGSTDASIRAICGMGGIGKTTIAKFVYNKNFNSFDGSSFLANIREVSEQPDGLLCLQRQLLLDISRRKHRKIHNVDEGLSRIKNLVCSKRVLLVLDDVEEADQLYFIFGKQEWLFPGSKVIITTRHERLLKPHHIYKVEKLNEDELIKLFSLHAFGEDCPFKSYTEHTKRAVQICEGLPLALKVLGSALSGKSEDEWVSELPKLDAIPHKQIVRKLKISYDSLQDNHDKRLFLDIACFFVGKNKDYTIKILEKCDFHAKIGIQNLIDRCLLTIDQRNVLGMHRLIQDLGREIIHQESDEAGERSRLWHHEDSFSVLKNETGTKTVEGLTLDMRMLKEDDTHTKKQKYEEFIDKSTSSKLVSSLKRHSFSFISGQSISNTSRSPNDVYLRTDAFKSCNISEFPSEMRNMKSLKELDADGIVINPLHSSSWEVKWWQPIVWSIPETPRKCPQTLWASLPSSLQILRLSNCNLSDESFPDNFNNLPSLWILNLKRNPFRRLPNCIKSLSKLFYLSISECHKLQSLELNGLSGKSCMIDAQDCTSLEKVTSLDVSAYLNLAGCKQLVEIEDYFKKESTEKFDNADIINYLGIAKLTKEVKLVPFTKFVKGLFEFDMAWLSRRRFGNQLEPGDEITITFDGKDEYKVKECGFKIVYHRDQEEENGGTTSIEKSNHDFPAFRLSTGEYFLCRAFQEIPDEDYWFPKVHK
ncbi:hypothetical protein LguiA_008380 [Lonicera macranthoides]